MLIGEVGITGTDESGDALYLSTTPRLLVIVKTDPTRRRRFYRGCDIEVKLVQLGNFDDDAR